MNIRNLVMAAAICCLGFMPVRAQEIEDEVQDEEATVEEFEEELTGDEIAGETDEEPLADKKIKKIKIPNEVRKTLAENGTVRVIVLLDVPDEKDDKDDTKKKQHIGNALGRLKNELKGTAHKLDPVQFDTFPLMALEIGPGEAALHVLEGSPDVISVKLDRQKHLHLNQSGPLIGANIAVTAGYPGTGRYIAIIDTGVDKTHDDLIGRVVQEVCFTPDQCPNGTSMQVGAGAAAPCKIFGANCGHGTHVANIAAGKKGIAPGAKIIAIQVAFKNALGGLDIRDADVVRALNWINANRATYKFAAVNMSLGGKVGYREQKTCDEQHVDYKLAIDTLRTNKIAVVISSGNEGWKDRIAAPACVSSAISVGATTKTDVVAYYSNSAPYLSVLGPGGDGVGDGTGGICSAIPKGTSTNRPCTLGGTGPYRYADGTSMAAPHIAGALADVSQKFPTASVGQLLNAVQTTGKRITQREANLRVGCRVAVGTALNKVRSALSKINTSGVEGIAFDINNCARISGVYLAPDDWRGFVTRVESGNWSCTGCINIGEITTFKYNGEIEAGGFYDLTIATTITNRDDSRGYYCCGFLGDQGFVKKARVSLLSEVNTPNTNNIDGDNDNGSLVGLRWVPDTFAKKFKFVNGVITDLSYQPLEITNMNWLVGYTTPFTGPRSGVIEIGITRTTFMVNGVETIASDISEAGVTVGRAGSSCFVRTPTGKVTTFQYPGASQTTCSGISDSYQKVGYFDDSAGRWPFIDLRW